MTARVAYPNTHRLLYRGDLIPGIVLIPATLNHNLLARVFFISETVKVNEHTVFIGRDIFVIIIHEVEHYISILVKSIEIVPVTNDNLQLLSLIGYEASQLPAVLISYGMEIHKEIYDGCEEVFNRIGEESLRTTFILSATFIQ